MKQELIWEQKDIRVYLENYNGFKDNTYYISRGDVGFTQWEKPELDYDILKKAIADYLEERDRKLMADIENEDFEADFGGFFDPDTEAY